ncbi:hypothetical protein [Sulfitobacter geojensis]|uniref:Uncharacterized protein n=1 Tax=Sulfitobacter geojensis TaxID=1342299 RepID=A0AAE3B6R1_9RHOB|nr:hypothetical protein [Sulfitobacter geojensis]MBM1690152.1 hypothetical protein [Sulfitobacter geojensis]MBM1694218.1 hypothetical protein [Sulfitobacter geojensis]MBM1706384.1 hypothetical protein [Sulfitobacter geojensis]MBM1710442.1 hypothetical protein [Sulfitobacter geojensis]MBM1714508.1 hypothetical protein [Sulfitobacter geojensis]
MTALTKYARLEATALWRATPQEQRREVIVSIGDATLVIIDNNDKPLAHWSLAAVERANPGIRPAIFHPDGDPGETLELPEAEAEMTDAIETLRKAIEKSRPRPGRLRWIGMAASVLVVAWIAAFWLPGAMQDHTLKVVPKVKRSAIGLALLKRIERVSGAVCSDTAGRAALGLLATRLQAGPIAVLPNMTQDSLHVPGDLILLDRSVIEDFEEPDITAGYIVTEQARRDVTDPLRDLLQVVGLRENFRLLTTGDVAPEALDLYAEHLMTTPPAAVDTGRQITRFERAALRSTPYAYARDITGETTLELIEGDPMNGKLTEPLMSDANWLRLQTICGG